MNGAEHEPEKEPRQERHRERLDQPVHAERDQQTRRLAPDIRDRREVHLHHHRRDHQPDQDRDRNVDLAPVRELQPAQALDRAGQELSLTATPASMQSATHTER